MKGHGYGRDPALVAFVQDNLTLEMTYWFGEELKIDSPASNRAWREFQRLSLERIQTDSEEILAAVAKMGTSQNEIAPLLADFAQRLKELDQQLKELPTQEREPSGESGLEESIEKSGEALLDAIGRESAQTREQVAAGFDRLAREMDIQQGILRTDLRLIISEISRQPGAGSTAADGLEQFRVREHEVQRLRGIFMPPRENKRIESLLHDALQPKVVWIVGAAGIGKRTLALNLALEIAQQSNRPIYRIPRSTPWHYLLQSGVRDAAIMLPDALGAVSLERPLLDDELRSLDELVGRGNWVLVTSPDSVYGEATRAAARLESSYLQPVSIDRKDIALDAMFEKLIEYTYTEGGIGDTQRTLARELLALASPSDPKQAGIKTHNHQRFQELMKQSWLPIDVERFVSFGLPRSNNDADIARLLEQSTNTATRVHTWFMNLEDATRAFVFTLTIFGRLSC